MKKIGLRCLSGGGILFRLIEIRGRHKHRELSQLVPGGFVAWFDQNLGIVVTVRIAGDFTKLQCVFVAVVGDDMDVSRAVRRLRLHTNEAARNVTSIEYPIDRIAREHIGIFRCWAFPTLCTLPINRVPCGIRSC